MENYKEQVKKLFALVKQNMENQPKKYNMSAQSLANLQKALVAVTEMEKQILANPYGIIWIDLSMHLFNCMKDCSTRSIKNVINLFLVTNKKSPVQHARDVNSVDTMMKMGAASMFGYRINPNTMDVVEPLPVQTKHDIVHSRILHVL